MLGTAVPARKAGWSIASAGLSIVLGATVILKPQVGFALVAGLLAILAIASPAGVWAIAALIAAVTFRGLVQLGVLPSVATFLDIPLAWGALLVALLRSGVWSDEARNHLRWLGALFVAVLASWVFHPSEFVRPILYLALLGEPFALVGALLLDPPLPRLRTALVRTAMVVVAIQVPLAFAQALRSGGPSDAVQGTLYGAGAGAHVMAAIVVVGGMWVLESRLGWAKRLFFALLLFAVPFLADAKQVIFAAPVALLVRPIRGSLILRVAVVGGSVFFLVHYVSAGKTAVGFVQEQASGEGGKEVVGRLIYRELTADSASLLFGRGPAETVSRSAFMTTDLLLKSDSPLRALHLRPAEMALEAQGAALSVSGGGTSFNSGVSSALGVLGDTGLVGALAYGGLLLSVMLALRRRSSPLAIAAQEGWAMLVVLGLVFDWWEQPPIGVFLAVLSGVALTSADQHGKEALLAIGQ